MTEPNRPALENKAAGEGPTSLDVVNAFDEFMGAFEAFKDLHTPSGPAGAYGRRYGEGEELPVQLIFPSCRMQRPAY